MIGITLSPEQIRNAPAEVRQWIEHEIASSLGLGPQAADATATSGEQLAACSYDELVALLPLIQGVFPAVNVFFELGRQSAGQVQEGIEAYRLTDLQHHTRLQSTEQVISCLAYIDEALHRVRGAADASFYGLNGGYCFIAAQTQQNIRRLWVELLGRGEAAARAQAGASFGDGPGLQEAAPPPVFAAPRGPAPQTAPGPDARVVVP